MTERDRDQQEVLKREALAWLARVGMGAATEDDLASLRRWRDRSPAHAAALARAGRLWHELGPPVAALAGDGASSLLPVRETATRRPSRRALIGAGVAAAVAGLVVVRPPLGLWPSLAELDADYRTATGEQRRLNVADAVSVELNTRTSVNIRIEDGAPTVELVSGEAAIIVARGAAKPFFAIAVGGRVTTAQATLNMRREGDRVCLTCIDGGVTVEHGHRSLALGPVQQVSYDTQGLGAVVTTDLEIVAAWRDGVLVFRNTPLAEVVEEVNRYRPGRIVLVDRALGRRLVSARFDIGLLDGVMEQIGRVFKVPVTALPGGVVLVG
jgi:transmembrane sensor